ncbi:pentapeptide repeat-containing protein [Nocardia beijingensis]|uniref:pentapeptide repeat-containing protein n=1 Tax=Nocardia beijingensis TaxID=95162 RepID=UPI00331CFE74
MLTWDGWLKLGAMAAAVGVIGTLWFTAHSFDVASKQARVAELLELTTRFAKGVEQLGSPTLDVRLGGIYSLERLARDSDADRATVVEVLAAFVRTHAPNDKSCTAQEVHSPAADVQAALTVIGRRTADDLAVDLSFACLRGAALQQANLRHVWLYQTNLSYAQLMGTDLRDSVILGCDLGLAVLRGADLTNAQISNSIFVGTEMAHPAARQPGTPPAPTTFDHVTFDGNMYDEHTTWPTGFNPGGGWLKISQPH